MVIPNLKRIKIGSEEELRSWLTRNSGPDRKVMIVTCNKKSRDKFVSSELVRTALSDHGWGVGQSYTLKGNLVGHVAVRA